MKQNITKENIYNGKKVRIDDKIDGLEIKPKNRLDYDAAKVNSMLLVNQAYIEMILRKKTKRKLDYCLRYILTLIDNDDEDPENLSLALDDLAHYKSIIEYKYRKFLDEKYVNLLLQKIEMLEHEIKVKMVSLRPIMTDLEEIRGKAR